MKSTIISVLALLSLTSAAPTVPTSYEVLLYPEQNYNGSPLDLKGQPTGFVCVNIPSSFNDKTRSLAVANQNTADKGKKICNFYTDINCKGQQHSYTFTGAFAVNAVPAAFDKKYSAFSCGATA